MSYYYNKASKFWSEDSQTSGSGDATATHAAEESTRHVITEAGGGGDTAATVKVLRGATVVDQFRVPAGDSYFRRYTPGTLVADANEKVEVVASPAAGTDSAEAFIGGFSING